jgi:hypothetical protein
MHIQAPTSRRVLVRVALSVALFSPIACKDDPKPDEAKPADAAKPAAKDGADATAKDAPTDQDSGGKTGLAGKIADGLSADIAPADKITRGDALAHIMVAHPTKFLDEIRDQVTPSKFAGMVNEAALKTLGSAPLGDKAALAQGLDLSKPLGCVLVNSTVVDVPVACFVGFKDGAAGFVEELGEEGKQADASGHTAHYELGGEHVFIDELSGEVVVSNHTDLFAKAKPYLETNMIGRASSVASDIEMVGFVAAAATRYESQLESVKGLMAMASAGSKTGEPAVDAFMDYNRKSQEQSFERILEMEQFTIGIGLEPVGFVARFASFPVEGSKLQEQAAALAAGPMDHATVTALPNSAWMAFGMHADWYGTWDSELSAEMRTIVIDAYAEATGKNAADVTTAVTGWVKANAEIYGNDMAFAMAYEPGTQGGIISSQSIKKAGGRDLYKKLSTEFTSEAVLGPIAKDWVTWSFELDAATVEGIAIDRMTIVPGPKLESKIRAEGGPELAEIEKRLGGLKLVLDRAETADRVYYVFAPKAEDKYLASALAAAKGTNSLADDKGIALLLARNPSISMAMAFNGAKTLEWVRDVFPPEATAKIPTGLGNDFSDSYMVSSYGKGGSQTGEWVMGQPLIDQIKKLAE